MPPQSLDLSLYVSAPRISVPSGIALGISLLAARPTPTPAPVHRAATRLRGAILELQLQWRRQIEAGLSSPAALRPVDTRVDRAFRALSIRLEALALLPAEASADVEVAATAHRRLFPDGLRFLTLPYPEQWAHCDRLLTTIDEDEALAADVERLVGEVVLTEARAAQAAYGEALGITTARESAEAVSLAAPLDALRAAIVDHAVQIVAMQSDDPSRLPEARAALAPIDALRAAQARRASSGSETPEVPPALDEDPAEVTPDTPVPAVDDESTAA